MKMRFLLLILILLYTARTKAQYQSDTAPDEQLNYQFQLVDSITGEFLSNPNRFIVGKLYYPRGTSDNHPFFLDNSWKPGWVYHNNEKYPVPMMKYDIEIDALIIMKTIGTLGYPIRLNDQVIRKFTIDGRHFTYLDSINNPGYYEEVYHANTKVWARWKKTDSNPIKGTPKYAGSVHFIILKEGDYYTMKSLGDFYEIFPTHMKELKAVKRDNKLSFRNNKTGTIRLLVAYYDSLNK